MVIGYIQWGVVRAGTAEFKRSITEPEYLSHSCQHAAVIGIKYVLLVYSAPAAMTKWTVLIHWMQNQQMKQMGLQHQFTTKYLLFSYQESGAWNALSLGEVFLFRMVMHNKMRFNVYGSISGIFKENDVKVNGGPLF